MPDEASLVDFISKDIMSGVYERLMDPQSDKDRRRLALLVWAWVWRLRVGVRMFNR